MINPSKSEKSLNHVRLTFLVLVITLVMTVHRVRRGVERRQRLISKPLVVKKNKKQTTKNRRLTFQKIKKISIQLLKSFVFSILIIYHRAESELKMRRLNSFPGSKLTHTI